MFKAEIVGNLGADAEVKESNGSKFVTMRVAHSTKFKQEDGKEVESTVWVDVTLSNPDAPIVKYLKAGTKVFVRGNVQLRVYSSKKDRCMKAGVTVNASEIELCGGSSDIVPRQLIEPNSGAIFDVSKFYCASVDTSKWKKEDSGFLVDNKGNQFLVVKGGWVSPVESQQEESHD